MRRSTVEFLAPLVVIVIILAVVVAAGSYLLGEHSERTRFAAREKREQFRKECIRTGDALNDNLAHLDPYTDDDQPMKCNIGFQYYTQEQLEQTVLTISALRWRDVHSKKATNDKKKEK